jgi:hypothetical protein
MLTEDDVRTLLRKAGETIHVEPGGPVSITQRRRPWLTVGVAAAVAAVMVAVFVAVGVDRDGGGGGGRNPGPVASTTPTAPAVRGDQLRDDQVPSVFAHTEESGRALLEEKELVVTVRYEDTCREIQGRALETRPGVGSTFAPGDAITLVVATAPAAARCAYVPRAYGWELIDFATERGAAPAFAPEVALYFNDDKPITLTAEAAADPAEWGPILAEIVARSGEVRRWEMSGEVTWYAPGLGAQDDDGTQFACNGIELGAQMPTPIRPSTMYSIGFSIPSDGPEFDCFMMNVFRTGDTGDGLIDAVSVRAFVPPEPTTVDVMPVVGLTEQGARTELEAQGLAVEVVAPEAKPDCTEGEPVVAEQEPVATSTVPAGSVVRLTMRWVPCGEVRLDSFGRVFTSFAGGDDVGPPFAEELRLYVGNQFQESLTYDEAMDRANWEVCPDPAYAGARGCPFSAVATLAAFDQEPTFRTFVAGCMADSLAEEPTGLGSRMLVIGDAEPRTCAEDFSVQLWVEDNRITAVNLLLGVNP